MSSPPPPPTATATITATNNHDTYWCHECDMSILHPLSTPPPRCPHCQNCILEHMDTFPPTNTANLYDPSLWGRGPRGGFARRSSTILSSLKTVEVGSHDAVESSCCICKDEFNVDAMANQLPCGHVFHNGCIVQWVEINSTCPLCRFSLGCGEEKELGEEAMSLDELLDDVDYVDYEIELRQLMRMTFSATRIGEAGRGGVVDRANSEDTMSGWPVGTSDVENVVRG